MTTHGLDYRMSAGRIAGASTVGLIVLLFLLGISGISHRGIASDERVEALAVFWNIEAIRHSADVPLPQRYYGVAYHAIAEVAFQAVNGDDQQRSAEAIVGDGFSREEFRARAHFKHYLNFFLSGLAYAAVAGLTFLVTRSPYSAVAALLLALMPRFWGHSFFNPKDLPFAVAFTVGTWAAAGLVAVYLRLAEAPRIGLTQPYAIAAGFGGLVGLITGTRIAGCVLIGFALIGHAVGHLSARRPLAGLVSFWPIYVVISLAWFAVVVAVHPASWRAPLGWIVASLQMMSRFGWDGTNLFRGYYTAATPVPLSYLPVWFAVTTPEIHLLLLPIGCLWCAMRFPVLSPERRACIALIGLQVAVLPTVAILRGSTVYDGLRQFLFVLPGIAVICGIGLLWVIEVSKRVAWSAIFLAVFAGLGLMVVRDMIALAPYEYVYFNRVSGGLKGADGRFDTDYYGLSMREAMEWIRENRGSISRVVASNPFRSAETYAPTDVEVVRLREAMAGEVPRPFYFVAAPRYDFAEQYPSCPIVFEVRRSEVPLTIVKRCD